MTTSGEGMDDAFDLRVAGALRSGVTSTAEARDRVMRAVRAAPAPVRGAGDDETVAEIAPLGRSRPFWRSPAFGLLAAASIAGVIALVRAVGVEGPIPDVPGQRPVAAARRSVTASETVVAPAAAGARNTALADAGARTARIQFVLVAPGAARVAVVGDFNDWNPAAAPLSAAGGVWSGQLDVPVGRHDYAFVVDGERWVRDPNAPQAPADEFGAGYSVLVVGDRAGEHR